MQNLSVSSASTERLAEVVRWTAYLGLIAFVASVLWSDVGSDDPANRVNLLMWVGIAVAVPVVLRVKGVLQQVTRVVLKVAAWLLAIAIVWTLAVDAYGWIANSLGVTRSGLALIALGAVVGLAILVVALRIAAAHPQMSWATVLVIGVGASFGPWAGVAAVGGIALFLRYARLRAVQQQRIHELARRLDESLAVAHNNAAATSGLREELRQLSVRVDSYERTSRDLLYELRLATRCDVAPPN